MIDKREGVWVLEGQCGDCGNIQSFGDNRPTPGALPRAVVHCDGLYLGRAGDRCRWPLSWAWIFIPEDNDRLDTERREPPP